MKPKADLVRLTTRENNRRRDVIVSSLRRMKETFHASSLKLSTEDAGMGFEQIAFWTRLCAGIMPVIVKIGGPNARNDINELVAADVDGFIAPMVESPYGLENFMEALRDLTSARQFAGLLKTINIETATAMDNLDAILDSPHARELDEITIGGTDLSKSMRKSVSDADVAQCIKSAVGKIKARGIRAIVGGGISPQGIDALLAAVRPDKFNTRVVTFDVLPRLGYRAAVADALEFEIQMLNHDAHMGFITRGDEKIRVRELTRRLKPAE